MAKFDNSIGINYLSSGDNISELFNDVGYITLNEVPPPTLQTVLETGNTGIDNTYTLTIDPSFIDILNDPIGNGTDITFSSFNPSYIQIGNFNNVNNIGKRTSLVRDGLSYATNNGNPTSSIINVTFQTPSTPGSNKTIEFKDQTGVVALLSDIPLVTGFVPYTGATSNVNLGTKNLSANNFFYGFSSVTASGTQIVLTINSVPYYVVTGSGGQTFKMPDATTLPKGAVYYFNNNQSSGAILLNNNSNTLIKSIPSGGYLTLELLDNAIAAGSWDTHFQAPSNVSWSTNTFDYGGSITGATWNGVSIADNRIASSATWNAKQDALGFIPVTNARTISTTAPLSGGGDLTANRTIAISQANTTTDGYLSSTDWNTFNGKFTLPALTSGSVLFSNGTTIAQSNANLFWDNTNARLGIGTNAPTLPLDVNGQARIVGTLNVGNTGSVGNISLKRTSDGSDVGGIRADASGTQIGGFGYSSNILLNNGATGTSGIVFSTGGERMRLFGATGNLGIGIATDAGFKLDVNGTARVSGTLGVKTASGQQRIAFANADQIYIGLGANNNQIGANSSNRLYIGSEGDLPIYTLAGGTVIVADLANPASSASAKLRIDSTTQGFLPPRMTTTQKNAIATPAAGLVVYDTTLGKLCVRGAAAWETITSI